MDRKQFIQLGGIATLSATIPGLLTACTSEAEEENDLFFEISLAQWSLHRSLFGEELMKRGWQEIGRRRRENTLIFEGGIAPIEFPTVTKKEFDINAVEYVNQFYYDKAEDQAFLRELKDRQEKAGVRALLIMCDAEGNLGDTNEENRKQAVENHYKWVEAANFLGCHSIRVNAAGEGTKEEVAEAAVAGLSSLSEYADNNNINVLVENHGGYSSNAEWLTRVIEQVNKDNCGTLPDFGNFTISEGNQYNRYKGVKQMMPYAKGVSAKSFAFNDEGEETTIDYKRMLKIVENAGYNGHIGIEYEGRKLDEFEGIRATKALLKEAGKEVSDN